MAKSKKDKSENRAKEALNSVENLAGKLTKKVKWVSEFKAFATRGNVVDMAVGIIIGAAFGQIVNSLVADVLMPPIGVLIGGVDFSELSFTIKAATADKAAVVVSYGKFIQTIINFIIIAFAIFMVVRLMNKLKSKEQLAAETAPKTTKDQELLGEIRDLLKDSAKSQQK